MPSAGAIVFSIFQDQYPNHNKSNMQSNNGLEKLTQFQEKKNRTNHGTSILKNLRM